MRSVDAVVVLAVVLAGCGGTVERRAGLGTADGSGGVSNLGGSSGSAGGATTVEGSGGDGLGGTGGRTTVVDAATLAVRKSACDHQYTAQWVCTVPSPPLDDAALFKQRFEDSCVAAFVQPGATSTAADLDACATALEASPCGSPDGPPLECDLRGSLAGGAPCVSATQCASGQCTGTGPGPTPGGPIPAAVTCGACVPLAAIGQSCDDAGCVRGSQRRRSAFRSACWASLARAKERPVALRRSTAREAHRRAKRLALQERRAATRRRGTPRVRRGSSAPPMGNAS